jgi:APA family basic amino acid/polyamine antiporter
VPARAELTLGAVVCVLVLTTDLRGAIGFSSFGVLVYYAVANAAAFTQDAAHRRWPRALNVVGLAGCAGLIVALPWRSVAVGALVLALGLAGRALRLRARGTRSAARLPTR